MRFSDLLSEKNILTHLSADNKEEVIEELIDLLASQGKISERENVLAAVLERERALSTGVGSGVAVPHATISSISEPAAALGRSTPGVEFSSMDGNPVNLVFLLLAPDGEIALHLKLLSRISRLCNNSDFRRRLLEAPDAGAILEAIRETEIGFQEF